MKSKNAIIFILTILVVYFAYDNYQLSKVNNDSEKPEKPKTQISSDDLNSMEDIENFFGRKIPPHAGEYIDQAKAKAKLKRFNAWNRKPATPGDSLRMSPIAFAFGISKIEGFISAINNINRNSTSSQDSIYAIRMYLVNSEKEQDGKKFFHNDLLLVPVNKDGNDYIKINKSINSSDSLLLNQSTPCPNKCDQ